MKNFIEWCKENKLNLESCCKSPVHSGKKVTDKEEYSGKVRKFKDDLEDYPGHMADNGTVDPFKIIDKKKKKKASE